MLVTRKAGANTTAGRESVAGLPERIVRPLWVADVSVDIRDRMHRAEAVSAQELVLHFPGVMAFVDELLAADAYCRAAQVRSLIVLRKQLLWPPARQQGKQPTPAEQPPDRARVVCPCRRRSAVGQFCDLANGDCYRYDYPRAPRRWLSGTTLCYPRAVWQRQPFVHRQGEDSELVRQFPG